MSVRVEKNLAQGSPFGIKIHEACQIMTNGDHEGQIFLSLPHTNNGFFLANL